LDEWRLIDVELDAGTELEATKWRGGPGVELLMQKWICKHKGLIPEIDIQSVPVDLTC
jgi:hypothetical protein